QLQNLSLPFQIQFFFVHAFALAALIALWQGLEGRRWWYGVAFACAFGATFSLGTGVLLVIPFLAPALWTRRLDRCFAAFFSSCLLLTLLYIWMIGGSGKSAPISSLGNRVDFFLTFLGNFVAERPIPATPVGAVVAACCIGLFSWLTWRALFCGTRWGREAVISAFALFTFLEALAGSLTRAHFGVHQALSLKYTTCSLLLVGSLFAFVWRAFPRDFVRVVASLALIAVLVLANDPLFENGWRAHNRHMNAVFADIDHGNVSAGAAYLRLRPELLAAVMSRFRELHLGPFRGTN